MVQPAIISIQELYEACLKRRELKRDVIIALTGERGEGKSSCGYRILKKFKQFKPMRDILFSKKEISHAVGSRIDSQFMADEMIFGAYKRQGWSSDNIFLIQVLNMCRDKRNVFVMCIPNFWDLDKAIRDLVTFHIFIPRRGKAVLNKKLKGRMFSNDPWDVSTNKKLEEEWAKKGMKPQYHKFSTFKAYIPVRPLPPEHEIVYQQVKDTKRNALLLEEGMTDQLLPTPDRDFYDRIIDQTSEGMMNKEILQGICSANKFSFEKVLSGLSRRMKGRGETTSYLQLLKKSIQSMNAKKSSNKNYNDLGYEVPQHA